MIDKFQEALDLIQTLTAEDRKHKSVRQLYIETAEELGEFCRAYSIESGAFGKAHKTLDEPAHCEAADLIICALALQFFLKDHCETNTIDDLWSEVNYSGPTRGNVEEQILNAMSILGTGSQYIKRPSIFMVFMNDLAIAATTLFCLSGGNLQELGTIMLKKLRKWENNQGNE